MPNNITTISSEIASILSTVQQAGSNAFVQVLEYPSQQFTGMPSVTVVPADVASQYATVVQNRRTYGFEVAIFVSVANPGDMSAEFAIMRTLVDAVLDALEQTIDLNGTCDFLQPVPMKWFVTSTTMGDALAAPINIMAQKDVMI